MRKTFTYLSRALFEVSVAIRSDPMLLMPLVIVVFIGLLSLGLIMLD